MPCLLACAFLMTAFSAAWFVKLWVIWLPALLLLALLVPVSQLSKYDGLRTPRPRARS